MRIFGWTVTILVSLLTGAVLELNKNTLAGWLLFALLFAAMIVLGRNYLGSLKWFARGLCVLAYTALCICIVFASWPPVRQVRAADTKDPEITDVYSTSFGDVTGVVLRSGVELFAGIPYAAPLLGDLRWKKPRDPAPWTGVLSCDSFAPMSMQVQSLPLISSLARIIGYHDYRVSPDDSYREPASEDSLYLNIWKPAGHIEKAPVAVYIHGGSLQTGQPWYKDYSGEGFAKDGIIVVNMGYRLGVFGFLASEEMTAEEGTAGNFGLLDQIKALEWVRDNIASFGGDPDNVTLIGESAGAVCADALCVSPLASGLFERVILESSTISSTEPPHSYRLFDEALSSGRALMERYGCSSLEELRRVPAEMLVGEQETQHHVTVDGYVLPDTPYNLRKQGIHNESALLHGFNKEESAPFLLFSHASLGDFEERVRRWTGDAAEEVLALYSPATDKEAERFWAQIYGTIFFNYSHYCLNRLEQENHVPSWEYLFSKDNGRLGCWHSGELVYTFGVIPEGSKLYSEEDRALADTMHGCWVSFIRTGDPGTADGQDFAQSEDSSMVMEFGRDTGMTEDPGLPLYRILDRLYGWDR